MMENYDEIRCDNARHTQKTLDALNTAILPEDMSDLLALNAEQQQNFNFGAEILTVQPQQQQQQQQNDSAEKQQQLHTLQAEEEEAAANNSCFLAEQQHCAGEREEEAAAELLLSTTVTERESSEHSNSYFLPEQQQQQHGLAQIQTNIEIKTTTTTTAEEGEFIVDKQIVVGGGGGSAYAANAATDESSGNIDEEDDEVDDDEGEGEDSDEDEEADEDDDDDEEDESETDATKNATANFQNKMNNIMHQNKQQNGQNGVHGAHGLGSSQEQTDETSSDSDFSDLSGLSDVSGREWKPISSRPMNWVQKQMHLGADPREILSQILPATASQIAPGISDMTLWRILASMLAEPPRRQKLRYINTFQDVVRLVRQAKNIIVLTGAGVSVSCGIPDFRSSDGIYSRLAKDYPDLPDPQAMFDINYFSRDPRPFYKFAREIYPGQFRPSPCHRFIKLLEQKQKLLRNYTQNIDTLEQVAGIRNKIECHGSFSTASCTKCKYKCDAEAIRADIFAQRIPVCPICQPNVHQSVDASNPVSPFELRRLVENGIMKPDIVFFGEGLPEEFHTVMASDKDKCDLLIVMGSSLKVRPVALIPSSIPPKVPQILINREQLHHLEFDVELLGDSDVIINQLCHCLGADWQEICYDQRVLQECQELLPIHSSPKTGHADEVIDELLLHDAETQSLKSESSADLVSITGTYSDSGFESSTSSKAIANSNLAGAVGDNLPPPELLEGPNDCHTFAERLAPPAAVVGSSSSALASETSAYNRHYSVDSTKDSGIGVHSCGESSNSSALTSHEQQQHGSALNIKTTVPTPTASPLGGAKPIANQQQLPKRLQPSNSVKSRPSAADRLPPGCYYAHESSAAYVFPGAQVNWSTTDTEDESGEETVDEALLRLRRRAALAEAEAAAIEGDDEKEADSTCCEDAEDDESQTATTVVDEELMDTVSTMSTVAATQSSGGGGTTTTTTVTKSCIKRHSSGGGYDEESSTTVTMTQVATSDEGIATSVGGSDDCSSCGSSTPPPLKKRRDSDGQPGSMTSLILTDTQEPPVALQQQQQQHTSAIITTTSASSSNNNNSFLSTSLEPPETLLQPQ